MTVSVEFQGRRSVGHGFGTGKPSATPGVQRSFAGTSTSWFQLAYDPGGDEEITKPYEQNVWVHAALKVLADAAASVDPVLWQTDAEDAEPVAESDPVYRLLQRPNKIMSRATLIQASMIHRKLDGEDFWFLTDAQGLPLKVTNGRIEVPAQIVPVRGGLVEAVWENETTGVNGSATTSRKQKGWRYGVADGGKSPVFPVESVVHFRDYSPSDMRRGLGDVQVLSRSLQIQFQAERYQEGTIRNSGDPGGFVVYDTILKPEETDRLEQEWNGIQSNPENRGALKVLDAGAKYQPNPLSPKDMEFKDLRVHGRTEILATLGVPPPLIGIFDDATYNNIETAERMLWTGGNGVASFLRSIEDTLDAFFFRNLRDARASKYVLPFDLGGVKALQEDNTEQIKAAAAIVQLGIGVSFNEALAMLNVEVDPPKNGDVRYVSPLLAVAGAQGIAEQPTNGAAAGPENGEQPGNGEGDSAPAAAPTPTAAEGDSVEGTGGLELNGAQIASIKDIVLAVALGELPRDAGKGMLMVLLGLSDQQAEAVLGSAGTGSKTTPNKPEGGSDTAASPGAPPTGPDDEAEPDDSDPGDEAPEPSVLSFEALRELRSADAKAWRREYWRRLDSAVLTPGEKALSLASRKYLRDYFDAQIKRLRAVASGKRNMRRSSPIFHATTKDYTPSQIAEVLLLDQDEWMAKMEKAVGVPLSQVYANALKDAVSDIGGFQVAVADPQVAAALSAQEIKLTEGVTSTLAKKVKGALVEALSDLEGGDIGSIQQAIAENLPELEGTLKNSFTDIDSRALAIARTETGQAANTARFIHMEENGIEKHEWITSLDDAVRPSHAQVEGQVRPIGEKFSNGLAYPNDPAAPASEVVNCRCTAAAVIEVPNS